MTLNHLEMASLEAFRSGLAAPGRRDGTTDDWIGLGIVQLLAAARQLRSARLALREHVELKEDGSPTIAVEQEVEARLAEALAEFAPNAAIVGEETGLIESLEGDSARARSVFEIKQTRDGKVETGGGCYEDTYRRCDGAWKFETRTFRVY